MKLLFLKLKKRWGIKSNFQIIIILIVFAITGTLSLEVGHLVLEGFGIKKSNFKNLLLGIYLYWTCRILCILIVYKMILLTVGFLFGQFTFFWNIVKKMLKRIGFKRLLN